MTTIAIIGAGDIGAAAARALAAGDRVGRVLLVDEAAQAAAGKTLDIQQSGPVDGFSTTLEATSDLTRVVGAAVCIIADRIGGAEWHEEEALAMVGRLVPYLSGAPLVCAGTGQADLMLRAVKEGGLDRRRIVGSAPEGLVSAIRAIVALEATCSPDDVMIGVLGAPPRPGAAAGTGFVVPWSEATVGGYALDRVLSQAQVNRVEARAARLWPPGPLTLGAAAARAAEAIVGSSRRRFHALLVLGGELGVRDQIGALPVLFNGRGIADIRVPALNTRERVLLGTALYGE